MLKNMINNLFPKKILITFVGIKKALHQVTQGQRILRLIALL